MPSLIPGYEYDIFISYRHKDNQYDGWVTEFVTNLKRELASTFKEEVSIYFDENRNDGLQETHDVNDSLEDKIKCLVFIPIVSRTYCDPTSFAWKHELLAFHSFANNDSFGLKIKVANGNVSSRMLPVRIHDLDSDDIDLFSKQTGAVMRPVDFVFKGKGVNRPLRALEDEPRENQNHIFYRDQINKVANTVNAIITAMKQPRKEHDESNPRPSTRNTQEKKPLTTKIIIATLVFLLLCSVGYGILTSVQSGPSENKMEQIDPSIAVLPFADMSEKKNQEYFSDGLSEELLNLLAKIPELKVISRTSAFSFKGKNEDIRTIGTKLNVAYILEGSVRKSADDVRITAQLIKCSDGSHIWSETFDRNMNDIFKVQDEIARAVVKELRVKLLGHVKSLPRESSPEVYNLWLQSKFLINLATEDNTEKAYKLMQRAYALDSTDARVWSGLAHIYANKSADALNPDEALKWANKARAAAEKALVIDPSSPDAYETLATISISDWDLIAAEGHLRKALQFDPANAASNSTMGIVVRDLGRNDESFNYFKKSIELDPLRPNGFSNAAISFAFDGNYTESIKYLRQAMSISRRPIYYVLLSNVLMLEGETEQAHVEAQGSEDEFWREYAISLTLQGLHRKSEADSMLATFIEKHADFGAFQIAEIYAWRGEIDKTFYWLERAYIQRDPGLGEVKSSLFLKPVTKDPRYIALLNKLKFPV